MARMKGLDGLLDDFKRRLSALIEAAKEDGRLEAVASIQRAVGGRRPSSRRGRRGARGAKRSKKPRKNSWKGLTPQQKLTRVNAIRKGRGLPPKERL